MWAGCLSPEAVSYCGGCDRSARPSRRRCSPSCRAARPGSPRSCGAAVLGGLRWVGFAWAACARNASLSHLGRRGRSPRVKLTPFGAVPPSSLSHGVFPSRFSLPAPAPRASSPPCLGGREPARLSWECTGPGRGKGAGIGCPISPRCSRAGVMLRLQTQPLAPAGNRRCPQPRWAEAVLAQGGTPTTGKRRSKQKQGRNR